MQSNQDNGGGGAKLPFRAMQKVVSEVGGLGCSRRGPKKGNFTASIQVWIHYKLAFMNETDAKPCSWSSGYGPWKFRCRLPGVTIQDLGSPWSNQPQPQTWRLSDSFISYLFSLTGKSGESLVNMWMFLCCSKCAAAAGHQPPKEEKKSNLLL